MKTMVAVLASVLLAATHPVHAQQHPDAASLAAQVAQTAYEAARSATENLELMLQPALQDQVRLAAEYARAQAPQVQDHAALAREAAARAREQLRDLDFSELHANLQELAASLATLPEVPPLPMAPLAMVPPVPEPPMVFAPDWHLKHGVGKKWHAPSRAYEAFLSEEEKLRVAALVALAHRDQDAAFTELERIVTKNGNWAMRAAAVEILGGFDKPEAIPMLRMALQKDTDQRVRLAAIRGLSLNDSAAAREALLEFLQR